MARLFAARTELELAVPAAESGSGTVASVVRSPGRVLGAVGPVLARHLGARREGGKAVEAGEAGLAEAARIVALSVGRWQANAAVVAVVGRAAAQVGLSRKTGPVVACKQRQKK